MILLPWKIMFLMMVLFGSIFAMSASSWFLAWIGLEINIIALLALLLSDNSPRNSEASLKYFLVQALASSLLIFSAFISMYQSFFVSLSTISMLILMSILIKLGASPFHIWVPQVIEGLNWNATFIVLTWQKAAPFILLNSIIPFSPKVVMITSIILSAVIGAMNGLSQSSIRKILSFSSINHLGWMNSALICSMMSWGFYFVIYSMILAMIIYFIQKMNFNSMSNFWKASNTTPLMMTSIILILSFGGLPPFLGFIPKWLIINDMVSKEMMLTTVILVFSSLITLFFYIRMIFPSLLMTKKFSSLFTYEEPLMTLILSINMTGLALMPLIWTL